MAPCYQARQGLIYLVGTLLLVLGLPLEIHARTVVVLFIGKWCSSFRLARLGTKITQGTALSLCSSARLSGNSPITVVSFAN